MVVRDRRAPAAAAKIPRSRASHARTAPTAAARVIALGGNAITQPAKRARSSRTYVNLEKSLDGILDVVERGYELVITHGTGRRSATR